MKIGALLKLLNSYAKLAESFGKKSDAQSLRDLRGLFSSHEDETVAKFVNLLIKRKPHCDGPQSSTIGDVRSLLFALRELLTEADCTSAASDIDRLTILLDGCQHSDLPHFVADAQRWSTQSRGRTRGGGAKLNEELVASYIDKLQSSERQNDLFDQVMQKLRLDKAARVGEVHEIASRFLGYQIAKKKTKSDALQAIEDRQAFNARQIARSDNQL